MAPTDAGRRGPPVLIGGVAQLYQGDLDFGRRAIERLRADGTDEHVAVEDLSYGAVAVTQRLEEVRPEALILVGAAARGRRPGTVERRRIERPELPRSEQRQAVAEAITGYVTIDLVLEVAGALGALPDDTVTIELEPVATNITDELSPDAEAALEPALSLVRAEVRRAG